MQRLRHKVRQEAWASTLIQKVYRSYQTRISIYSWYRDYWIKCYDESSGDTYYYNTWSEEVRHLKPLEMAISERINAKKEETSKGPNDDEGKQYAPDEVDFITLEENPQEFDKSKAWKGHFD